MPSSNKKDKIKELLKKHHEILSQSHISKLFSEDINRAKKFTTQFSDLYVDYSKNFITNETLDLLLQYAASSNLETTINAMFKGEKINHTEDRAALHVALRGKSKLKLENIEIENDIKNELKKIKSFVCDVHEKKITGWTNKSFDTFVNIGAGGSDLGSKMAVKGLAEYRLGNTHSFFISNVDPDEIESIKKKINPETTLFIISSKSSSTLETITNANTLKSWMVESGCKNINKHFFVVSSNMKLIKDFGLSEDNLFKIWDWVGGRFSLWSAAGLPTALAIGFENFEKMLTGAFAMDQHFLNESPQNNIPVILALIDFWYIRFFNTSTHALIPYDESLRYLPEHLAQLFMESNGKSTDLSGRKINHETGSIAWGTVGTNAQHSISQLLHQGKHLIPIDFLVPLQKNGDQQHHQLLLANCLAQSRALMLGENNSKMHLHFEGSRPSTTILYKKLTPELLGTLIAMYEHRVFIQGQLLEVNPFDQFGVELGKKITLDVLESIKDKKSISELDSSTKNLIAIYKNHKKTE